MGDNLTSVNLGTGRTATAIAVGGHACALLDNGQLKCWGNNAYGQLGLGNDTNHIGDGSNEMGDNLTSVNLGNGRTATAIFVGASMNCALLDNSEVKCWGDKNGCKLGKGHSNRIGDDPNEMGDNLTILDL